MEEGIVGGDHVMTEKSHRPLLWSDPSFKVVEFTGSCLPFLENFLGDYQALLNKAPSELMRLS